MEQFKSLGLTFGNVITYNALLESCALAARDESHVFAATALSVMGGKEGGSLRVDNRSGAGHDAGEWSSAKCCNFRCE
eukprot:749769-Hanusia_phi.AAC.1